MRKLVLAVAVAMASGKAFALGLGEIQLHSSLNEPLNAEIQLISERPAELQGAVVRLAPQDAFSQAGIEWPAVLGDLKFNVVQQNGATVVKVTSSQPVREPFLDFIVQLQWPSGRLLREYTVLLDPPMFSGEKAAPIAAPIASAPTRPAPSPAPAAASAAETPAVVPSKPKSTTPAPSAPSSPVAAAPATRPAVGPNGYGPTQRADTAWAVANQVRPDAGVTVQQAMLALLEANPEAFYRHNVNNLIAGHILRIPARDLMTAVSAADAEREVNRQYQQWRQAKSGVPVTAEAPAAKPGSGADASASAPAKGEQTSRLRLAAPGASNATAPGAGGGKDIDKLHNDLAIALESADAARRENEELRSRLSALEGQINSMQRLLTLKDGTLADMQKQPGAATEIPPPATPPAAETPSATAPAEAPAPAPPKSKPAVKPAPAETPTQSFSPFDNPALLAAAGGGALLLVALAWLIVRRRREGATSEEARLEPIVAQAAAEAAAAQAMRANTVESAVAAADEASLNPRMGAVAEEVAKGVEGTGAETANDLDMMHTAEGDIDPIVEADVYLAYRRYQQAEALIQAALAKQPQRLELKVKLLEIYYAARNTDSFRSVAESLHNDLWQNPDDALWQRVVAMGAELLPDHFLFAGGTDAPKAADAPVATAGAGAALFAAGDAAAKVADGELPPAPQEDFLGLGADDTAAARTPGGDESLDLDLNLGAQTEIAHGGDGLDDTVHGASGAVPDIETGKDVAAASSTGPAAGGKDKATGSSWQTEPALSDFGMDFNLDDADFLAGTDVVGTKLDLARAYIDMGDHDSARDILKEVMSEGNPQQKQEAQALSQQLA